MTRVAAIDCGTNSLRLLVADADPRTGRLTDLTRRMEIVRLGQGVDRTGVLAPDALERTFAVCREYAAAIAELGAVRTRFVATSATRDARNREEFARGVTELLGVAPEVVTGEQEAALSFTGATRELASRPDLKRPFLVFDIGGGSTEFVLGDDHDAVRAGCSVDVGCVRMTERHVVRDGVLTDPPSRCQISAIRSDIEAALDRAAAAVPLAEAGTLVGLAGSVTTLAAIALDLPEYDSARVHHSVLGIERVREITDRLLSVPHAERAAIPVMHPGRADVIGAGALVLLAVMERTGAKRIVVSEHDILDGIAFSAAAAADG